MADNPFDKGYSDSDSTQKKSVDPNIESDDTETIKAGDTEYTVVFETTEPSDTEETDSTEKKQTTVPDDFYDDGGSSGGGSSSSGGSSGGGSSSSGGSSGGGTYDPKSKTYTSPKGHKKSMAKKDIPKKTRIVSENKFNKGFAPSKGSLDNGQKSKGKYDVSTKTYTTPSGGKQSRAKKDVPTGTKVVKSDKNPYTRGGLRQAKPGKQGTYNPETKTYTDPQGNKKSMALKDVPDKTKVITQKQKIPKDKDKGPRKVKVRQGLHKVTAYENVDRKDIKKLGFEQRRFGIGYYKNGKQYMYLPKKRKLGPLVGGSGSLAILSPTGGKVQAARAAVRGTGKALQGSKAGRFLIGAGRYTKNMGVGIAQGQAFVRGSKKVGRTTAPEKQQEIMAEDKFQEAVGTAYKAEQKKVSKKGFVRQIGYDLTQFAGSKKAYNKALKEELKAQGYTGKELDTAMKAGKRTRTASAIGEVGALVGSAGVAESVGRKGMKKAGVTTAKTGWKRAGRSVGPLLKAGSIEGVSQETAQQTARKKDLTAKKNLKQTALMGAAGGVTAPVLGAPIAGLSGAKTAGKRGAGKVINVGANIADPYELPGDLAEKGARKGLKKAAPVMTGTPTTSKSKTKTETVDKSQINQPGLEDTEPVAVIRGNKRVPVTGRGKGSKGGKTPAKPKKPGIISITPTPSENIGSGTTTDDGGKGSKGGKTPSDGGKTPTDDGGKTPSDGGKTPTITKTNTYTDITTNTNTPTPTATPTSTPTVTPQPRVPPPFMLPVNSKRQAGTRVGKKPQQINELQASKQLLNFNLGIAQQPKKGKKPKQQPMALPNIFGGNQPQQPKKGKKKKKKKGPFKDTDNLLGNIMFGK